MSPHSLPLFFAIIADVVIPLNRREQTTLSHRSMEALQVGLCHLCGNDTRCCRRTRCRRRGNGESVKGRNKLYMTSMNDIGFHCRKRGLFPTYRIYNVRSAGPSSHPLEQQTCKVSYKRPALFHQC